MAMEYWSDHHLIISSSKLFTLMMGEKWNVRQFYLDIKWGVKLLSVIFTELCLDMIVLYFWPGVLVRQLLLEFAILLS